MRGSEPPISTPRSQSIWIACPPPSGERRNHDVVAARLQALDRRGRHAALDHRLVAVEERARGIDRRLHVHAVVDHVGDHVRVAHRLIVRAHHAERHVAAAFRIASAGMMVCIGRLPGAMRVRMTGIDHEAGAAIVQHDAGLLGTDAGAERAVERIDERHRGAVAVDDREIDRVAARRRRLRQRHAFAAIDLRGELALRSALSIRAGDRHAHSRRLGDVRVAHRKGKSRGFERQVKALRARADRAHPGRNSRGC